MQNAPIVTSNPKSATMASSASLRGNSSGNEEVHKILGAMETSNMAFTSQDSILSRALNSRSVRDMHNSFDMNKNNEQQADTNTTETNNRFNSSTTQPVSGHDTSSNLNDNIVLPPSFSGNNRNDVQTKKPPAQPDGLSACQRGHGSCPPNLPQRVVLDQTKLSVSLFPSRGFVYVEKFLCSF